MRPPEHSSLHEDHFQQGTQLRLGRKLGLGESRKARTEARRHANTAVALLIVGAFAVLWLRFASITQAVMAFVVGFYTLVFLLHNLILLPFGLWYRRKKVRPLRDRPPKDFAILAPAHNEAAVIGSLVENLLSLDYPKEHYDIFVIADNCTDDTADRAREAGAIVHERFDPAHKTKAHALKWMIDRLGEAEKEYDAIVVIDSDNLVDSRYLLHMNERLQRGERLIQGYLDVKNPFDSWISSSAAIGYWSTNRLWQLPKHRLGLSSALGGTGMCIEAKLLQRLGWSTSSFTEDLDFQCRALLAGVRTTWAHEARVYDEKPNHLRASMRQRERWMIGHNSCRKQYFWPLLKRGVLRFDAASLDSGLYLLYPMLAPAWLLLILLTMLNPGSSSMLSAWLPSQRPFHWLLALLVGTYGFPYLGLLVDGAPERIYRALWYYPIYCLTWIPVVVVSFLRRQKTWAHTEHLRSLALDEVLHERVG